MIVDVKKIYEEDLIGKEIIVEGWVRNHRKQKEFGFIDFSDGTCFKHIQLVYDNKLEDFDNIQKLKVGASIHIEGVLERSSGKGQSLEIQAKNVVMLGDSADDYPIQPKRHTMEFLRAQAYLRPRTNLFSAVFRVRSVAAMAIHTYLQDNGFVYVHSPIFTDSDCEGAGEMFQVTTLDLQKVPKNPDGTVDYSKDLFGKKVGLTVSGQLEGETFSFAFKRIYTFGPTFRAENSNTKIHACEFWQIEPEMAFCDLEQLMEVEEGLLKFVVGYVLEKCPDEMEFLNKFVDNTLLEKLNTFLKSNSVKIDYTEVVELLKKAGRDWEFKPEYGADIAKEHEKYLTEELFKCPVFVKNWPKEIKSFYMKQNDDGKTVAAVDYLVPGAGELMGGSQREEDYDKLIDAMKIRNMNIDAIAWYTNLRRYGSCVHSGFGMGFERLMIYLTGVENIRDVVPYPRTPRNCLY